MRGCCALAVVATTLGLEDHAPVRRLQGFGVGVVVDPMTPAPATILPVPEASASTAGPTTSPATRSSNAPSTVVPSLAPRAVDTDTPLPTPLSTGGAILMEGSTALLHTSPPTSLRTSPPTSPQTSLPLSPSTVAPASLPPVTADFQVEFQIVARGDVDQSDAIYKVEVSLTSFLLTLELSLDTEQTQGPIQVTNIDSSTLGMQPVRKETSHF
jgi:hypothetical protein